MMDVARQEQIISIINEKFGRDVLEAGMQKDFLTLIIAKDKIIAVLDYLFHHTDTKFQYLTTLCGIHYPDQQQIAVMYQVHNLYSNERIRFKIFLPESNPVAPTLTTVFAAANWMERETYDFFGVTFEGHPNLTRILNVDEMTIFPLRKEYPLEDQTREDKNDKLFGR